MQSFTFPLSRKGKLRVCRINVRRQLSNRQQTLICCQGDSSWSKQIKEEEETAKEKNDLQIGPSFSLSHCRSLRSQWENWEFVKRSQWIKVMLQQATCQATGVLTLGRPERERMCHLHPDQWTLGSGPKNGAGLRIKHCYQSLSYYNPSSPAPTPPKCPHD